MSVGWYRTEPRTNNDYHTEGVENMIYKGEKYIARTEHLSMRPVDCAEYWVSKVSMVSGMGVHIGVAFTCELDAFLTVVRKRMIRRESVRKRTPSSGHDGQ